MNVDVALAEGDSAVGRDGVPEGVEGFGEKRLGVAVEAGHAGGDGVDLAVDRGRNGFGNTEEAKADRAPVEGVDAHDHLRKGGEAGVGGDTHVRSIHPGHE